MVVTRRNYFRKIGSQNFLTLVKRKLVKLFFMPQNSFRAVSKIFQKTKYHKSICLNILIQNFFSVPDNNKIAVIQILRVNKLRHRTEPVTRQTECCILRKTQVRKVYNYQQCGIIIFNFLSFGSIESPSPEREEDSATQEKHTAAKILKFVVLNAIISAIKNRTDGIINNNASLSFLRA